MSRVDEIEYMIACNELTAAQVFTQMRQLIPNKNIEAERDALRLRVGDLEQAFNYIKSELKEVHTVNCYPPINNYDPVIINVLKVCEVVLKNKLEVSDNE